MIQLAEDIAHFKDNLAIERNSELTQVEAIKDLTSLNPIFFRIVNNEALINVKLNNVIRINGDLVIDNYQNLRTVYLNGVNYVDKYIDIGLTQAWKHFP